MAARTDGGYDFVLLDCPPAVGLITVNALVAATDLIIPVQPEVASLYGLVSILDTVAVIRRKINR
ncbi:ParA family protein, partial [Phocaeicola vulgatus]|uniref:ParA family protein n=1 Tax=Phocaeicola vulgatus TaxID=821 RepID=UPI00216ABCB1